MEIRFLSLSELEMRNEPVLVLLIPPRERPAQKDFYSSEHQYKPRAAPYEKMTNESYPLAPAQFEAHAHASTEKLKTKDVGKFSAVRREKIAKRKAIVGATLVIAREH